MRAVLVLMDAEYANAFIKDVAGRLGNRVQLTTDGLKAYLGAVEDAFGADVDYAQLVKLYGETSEQYLLNSGRGRPARVEYAG